MAEYESDINLGKLGETKLTEWCTAAGLTSNRSLEEDKMGWDHLIEFPYERTILPRDKQPKPIECKIQVKSTLRTDKGVKIKLSSLKRLIDYTSPSFILFYEYSNKQLPELDSSYLVHVDDKLIARVLKAIRKNDMSNNSAPLNQIELKVSYSKKNKLDEDSGIALRDKIVSFVPDGIAEYQRKKHQLTETIGYENNGYKLKFSANSDDFSQHLLESAIGYNSFLNVKNAIINDNRFNLTNGEFEIEKSSTAKIKIEPNIIDKCKLHFKTGPYSSVLSFDAELLKIPNTTSLTNSLFFRTKLFSIELLELHKDSVDCRIHFTIDRIVELSELTKFFKLFNKANYGKKLIFETELENEERVFNWSFQLEHQLPDSFPLVQSLEILRNSFELDCGLLTTVNEIYSQRDRVAALAYIIQNNVSDMQFEIKPDVDDCTSVSEENEKIIFSMIVPIGPMTIGVISHIHGNKIAKNKYQAYRADVLDVLTFRRERPTKQLIKEMEAAAIEKLDNP
ncbi:MAG: hypothetical protein ACRC1N_12785 [Aeromonas sobria]